MSGLKMFKSKRGNVLQYTWLVVVFSFISIVALTFAFFNFGILNDYLFFELQEIVDDLGNQSIIGPQSVQDAQLLGDTFTNFNFHYDDLWILAYFIFVVSTLIFSYQERSLNHFSFLTVLFYGVIAILFLQYLFGILTDWWNTEILLKLFPSVTFYLPKFYYYINHLGIFNGIHIVLLLIINKMDFDFSKIITRKKIEQSVTEDSEVI